MKMTIVLNRGVPASKSLQVTAISKAVIGAYENCSDKVSLMQWELNSWAKICLKIDSSEQLLNLDLKAKSIGISSHVHYELDASKGEASEKAPIVCVIGPALASKVNEVTGHLKLL